MSCRRLMFFIRTTVKFRVMYKLDEVTPRNYFDTGSDVRTTFELDT